MSESRLRYAISMQPLCDVSLVEVECLSFVCFCFQMTSDITHHILGLIHMFQLPCTANAFTNNVGYIHNTTVEMVTPKILTWNYLTEMHDPLLTCINPQESTSPLFLSCPYISSHFPEYFSKMSPPHLFDLVSSPCSSSSWVTIQSEMSP